MSVTYSMIIMKDPTFPFEKDEELFNDIMNKKESWKENLKEDKNNPLGYYTVNKEDKLELNTQKLTKKKDYLNSIFYLQNYDVFNDKMELKDPRQRRVKIKFKEVYNLLINLIP